MHTRQLGPFTVSAIGLGAMPVSMNENNKFPNEADAIAVVHAALDAGVTFIDTADIYAPSWDTMGHNELIVGKAVQSWGGNTANIVIGTKGGITRGAGETWGRDGSLSYLRSAVQKSLDNLGVEVIDLYQWHRPDRWKVYGDVIANFKTLQDEGLIKTIGISNANVEEIEIAV
ncbi:MAG: aldo/keto reductase, partial [Friedmanniella sp.]|nr:aldo/keto reductase [Friedmanniella sp.]